MLPSSSNTKRKSAEQKLTDSHSLLSSIIEIGINLLEIIKDPRDREKILAAGCDDYISKAVDQKSILG